MSMDFNAGASAFVDAVDERQETILAMAGARERASESIYAKVIRWALVVGTFLMPLFFLPWTTSVLELNKELLLLVMAGVLLVAWLLSMVSTGKLSWRTGPFGIGLLAVGAATLVGALFSVSRFTSVFGGANVPAMSLVSVLSFIIFYFVAFNSEHDMGERLANTLSVSVAVALLYGVLQIVGAYIIRAPFAMSHAFNSIGSVNALGIAAAVSLPLFKRGSTTAWMKYVNWLGILLALAVLVLLNWWVLWTVAIVGMVGLIAFQSLGQEKFSISRFVMPMTVIVLGIFLMLVNFSIPAVKNNLPVEVAPSFRLSAHVLKKELTKDLVTGIGPSMYTTAFDQYGAAQLTDSTLSSAKFYTATSELFSSATQGGLLMLLAMLAIAWGFFRGVRYIFKHRTMDIASAASWSMLLAAGAAFVLYPFTMSLAFLSIMALLLASLSLWGDRLRTYNIEDNVALSLTSSLGFIGGLILVLAGIYFGVSIYIADAQYARATTETDINKAAADLVSAVNWNGANDAYYRAASQVSLGLLNQELQKPADPKDTQQSTRINNYVTSAINLAKQATTTSPQEYLNWSNLGNVYGSLLGLVDGVDKLSEDAYTHAATLRPGDASFYSSIGDTYSAKASLYHQLATNTPAQAATLNQTAAAALVTAEANYLKAIDMSPNFGLAIYNLGNVYAQENKLPQAIAQLEKIAPFNSDQPNLLFQLGLLYYQNAQHDKAFTTMQQVLVLSPDFANAHWYLSLIYEERKDIPNAIDQLQKILSVDANKDNQTVKDRLTQLQAGQATTTGVQKPL